MRRFLLLTATLLALTACTVSNSDKDFLCGAQEGQPCRTMSEVDGRGAMVQSTPQPVAQARVSSSQILPGDTRARLPERTGRMWIAPYLDVSGVVHEGATVQFVVRSPRWTS